MKKRQGTGKPARKKRQPLKAVTPPPPLDINSRYKVREASANLKQSHMTTYKLIDDGILESYKQGGTRWIKGRSIARVIDGDLSPVPL